MAASLRAGYGSLPPCYDLRRNLSSPRVPSRLLNVAGWQHPLLHQLVEDATNQALKRAGGRNGHCCPVPPGLGRRPHLSCQNALHLSTGRAGSSAVPSTSPLPTKSPSTSAAAATPSSQQPASHTRLTQARAKKHSPEAKAAPDRAATAGRQADVAAPADGLVSHATAYPTRAAFTPKKAGYSVEAFSTIGERSREADNGSANRSSEAAGTVLVQSDDEGEAGAVAVLSSDAWNGGHAPVSASFPPAGKVSGLASAASGELPPDPNAEYKMLAAVDMGTNSFHMVIVRADSHGRFQIVDVEKDDVRLGSGSMGFSVIHPDAENRAIAAIQRFKKIAATRGAQMRVVATSAVREARNKRAYVRRVKDVTGVDVEILSGTEEACFIYLGILQALPVYEQTVLTVDIGGGSTEFVLGKAGKPLYATSLKLGHISLTEQCLGGGKGPLQKSQVEELRRHIRVMLADSGVLEVVNKQHFDVAIGSSGTIETIEQMIHLHSSSELDEMGNTMRPRHFKEPEFTKEELELAVKRVLRAKTSDQRSKLPGLPEKRSDVIVGGAVLLEEIFNSMGIKKMKVSPYALREGVIVDTLARSCAYYHPTPDIRRASVRNLAARFNTERRMESARHAAHLALDILAGLQTCRSNGQECVASEVLFLNEEDAFLMEAATRLHYVGMFISHSGYHKHSYYLIKNNEHLLGFGPMEVEVIALLARYHRKKVPSTKDEQFAKLPEDVQSKIKSLCAIMRVAVALDRCSMQSVEQVSVLQDMDSCVLAVTPRVDPDTGKSRDVTLEVWAANQELIYFNKVFRKNATIVIADSADVVTLDKEVSPSLSS